MKPRYSIIVPTYNRGHLIEGTIHSVLNQSFQDFELLIIDDGSTDDTTGKIARVKDSRVHYFYKANEERAIARNFGIDKSAGQYVTFLDSDDLLYPDFLVEVERVLNQHPEASWMHVGYEIKDENGRILRQVSDIKRRLPGYFNTGNHLSCIGVVIKKDILIRYRFNEDRDIIGSEDYLLWMRIAARHPLYTSQRISASMIQHSQRSVINFTPDQLTKRVEKTIRYVLNDRGIVSSPDFDSKTFVAHRYLYLALHLALINQRKLALTILMKAVVLKPSVLASRKVAGVVKAFLF